ncbi:MAG: glycosyltransferase [Pseudomonadota bacterium]|nr:glycosyltransferase [Pseudomonadota bacterium]
MLKVLLYNWADAFDPAGSGGGVTVYQRNLIKAFQDWEEVEVHSLCSGTSYDLTPNTPPRWELCHRWQGPTSVRRFRIVNSGVLAPAHADFGAPTQVDEDQTRECFFDFLKKTGPYDVVHFNNLEGLPASVLSLKQNFPETKVIFSLHNYYPFCAQVNLWRNEAETCSGPGDGRRCVDCVSKVVSPTTRRAGYAIHERTDLIDLSDTGRIARWTVRAARLFGRLRLWNARARSSLQSRDRVATQFAGRAGRIVRFINENCDWVLCVSESVRRRAVSFGISPQIAATSYIGTKAADGIETPGFARKPSDADGTLTIAYLGYMRRDKGFFFLMDALERLPKALKARLRVVIAARTSDQTTAKRLKMLQCDLASLKHWDGYRHGQLDSILQGVHLGIVPVLWRDNLPQTAIEMHARGIPLLTSHLGGAKELCRRPELVFEAGCHDGFAERLTAIVRGEVGLKSYRDSVMQSPTMGAHIAELLRYYTSDSHAVRGTAYVKRS